MLRDFKKEKYDIFIQAGQSNSEGYGFGPVDTPFCQRDPVYYLNPDFIISMASERINGNEIQSNFSLPFAIPSPKRRRKPLPMSTSVKGTSKKEEKS